MTFLKNRRIIKHEIYDKEKEKYIWIWGTAISIDGIPTLKDAERLLDKVQDIVTREEGQEVLASK